MNEIRNVIINEMVKSGYYFTGNVEESHYYFSNGKVMVSYVTPHSGTDLKHMIRAEIVEDFDRWSNAQYEVFIVGKNEMNNVIKQLDEIESVEVEE